MRARSARLHSVNRTRHKFVFHEDAGVGKAMFSFLLFHS